MAFKDRYSKEDNSNFIYHYGGPNYKEIKTRRMMGMSAPKKGLREDYIDTFSAFPEPLSKKQIQKFRSSGFKAWQAVPLPIYEYKIKISDNINAFDGDIKFAGLPQNLEKDFRFGDWARYLKTKGIDFQKMYTSDKYWEEIKDQYMKEAKSPRYDKLYQKWFKSKFGSGVTAQNFSRHPFIKFIKKGFNKMVSDNITTGNKNQYATNIPHIYTKIKQPLKIHSSKKNNVRK